jgi:hypothetical protein
MASDTDKVFQRFVGLLSPRYPFGQESEKPLDSSGFRQVPDQG